MDHSVTHDGALGPGVDQTEARDVGIVQLNVWLTVQAGSPSKATTRCFLPNLSNHNLVEPTLF